jgi:head-tail adaptor
MRAGEKKRRIRIEVLSTSKSTFGSDVETWSLLREVWASMPTSPGAAGAGLSPFMSGEENFSAEQINSQAFVYFKIDYITGLSPKLNRIRYNNQIYDIYDVQEVGYREALMIRCRLLAIAGVGEGVAGSEQQSAPPSAPSLIRQGTFYSGAPANGTIVIISYAEYEFTINRLNNLKTESGSITLSVLKNGVAITGLSNLAVTSTPQNPEATAGNAVSVGDRITFVFSNNASAAGLEFTMKSTV